MLEILRPLTDVASARYEVYRVRRMHEFLPDCHISPFQHTCREGHVVYNACFCSGEILCEMSGSYNYRQDL